ncbi:hypothetical protein Bca52824_025580 [Brassica carinata]|uniref:t-SNARE coiled-coil homology domain-containing protein n=1 Tax=Brassica carinata TaxID=52824 RepID=A0A8X7SGY4_BRACI|nr:hypothetical protein Bca52824_025580 [Brassica carinata]
MTKKVKLALVENEYSRAVTLKKRRSGLVKKEAEPMVWPSAEAARNLLKEFNALRDFAKKKNETTLESYLKEKTSKVHENLRKTQKENMERKTIDQLKAQLSSFRRRNLDDLDVKEIYSLISFSKDAIMHLRRSVSPYPFDFMSHEERSNIDKNNNSPVNGFVLSHHHQQMEQPPKNVMHTINEIQERHDAVKDIEKNLRELHQVFLDMAVLVEHQGAQLDDIESHVGRASSFIRGGTEELHTARVYQKNTRKWTCYAIIILIIILVVVVLAVVKPWQNNGGDGGGGGGGSPPAQGQVPPPSPPQGRRLLLC